MTLIFECPDCSGDMVFTGDSNSWKCISCGEECHHSNDPLRSMWEGMIKKYDVRCPQCGHQASAPAMAQEDREWYCFNCGHWFDFDIILDVICEAEEVIRLK